MSVGRTTECARGLLWLGCAVALAGCSAAHYRRSADQDVYNLIAGKSPLVTNMDSRFTLERTNMLALDALPATAPAEEFLGQASEMERGARVLSLEKALDTAVKHSRVYQNSKEQLYLTALSLTLSRHQFAPLFSGGGQADYAVQTEQAVDLVPDPANPGEYTTVLSDNLAEQQRVSGSMRTAIHIPLLIQMTSRNTREDL